MRFGEDNLVIFTKIKMHIPFDLKTPLLGNCPINKLGILSTLISALVVAEKENKH